MSIDRNFLPQGWIAEKLSQVIQPRGEKVSPSDCPDLEFLGMDHVEAHTTRILGSVPAHEMKSSAARFYSGDVLYGRLRPYLNKVAKPVFGGLASAEFIVFPDTELLTSGFLKYRLNAADFVSFASHLNEGDRPRVNFDQIGDFQLLVPPSDEQRRIVAKIEALFSELDKGIEALKTAREQLKVYRQAVLKHAFEGRLTAQWREENKDRLESPEQLLARIQHEREARYQEQLEEWKAAVKVWENRGKQDKRPAKPKKLKELQPFSEAEIEQLPLLPPEWRWVKIDELCAHEQHAIKAGPFGSALKKEFYVKEGYKIYGQEQVIAGDSKIGDYFIDEYKFNDLISCRVQPNDILVSLVGTVGKVLILPEDAAEGIINPRLIKISPNVGVYDPRFFKFYFESAFVRNLYKTKTHGATMDVMNLSILRELPFPLFPIEEQLEVISVIESIDSEIENLSCQIDRELQASETLRQSILKKAFSGQLVPQDPSDESASVLLERIRAEKVQQTQPARKTRRKKTA